MANTIKEGKEDVKKGTGDTTNAVSNIFSSTWTGIKGLCNIAKGGGKIIVAPRTAQIAGYIAALNMFLAGAGETNGNKNVLQVAWIATKNGVEDVLTNLHQNTDAGVRSVVETWNDASGVVTGAWNKGSNLISHSGQQPGQTPLTLVMAHTQSARLEDEITLLTEQVEVDSIAEANTHAESNNEPTYSFAAAATEQEQRTARMREALKYDPRNNAPRLAA